MDGLGTAAIAGSFRRAGLGWRHVVRRSSDSLRSAAWNVGRILSGRGPAGRNGDRTREAADEQPLREELFSLSQLEDHAKSLTGWQAATGRRRFSRAPERLLARLSANEKILRDAYDLVAEGVKGGRRITPAAEWFLDNYHLIEEQIRTARRHLPRGYNRELPRLTDGPFAGYPRVYSIALELISHADGRVDSPSLRAFVASYQSANPLRLGELWAIPIMLRLALLENLRRGAARVMAGRRERERAGYWVERMLEIAAKEPAKVVLVLAEMVKEDPSLTNAFASEFASRLQGQSPALVVVTTWFEQRLAEQAQTFETVFQQASQSQAADQVSIGNSIGSLRFLGATDWREFVEANSLVERELGADPAGVYPRMDFATRDRYRHAVEDLARRSDLSEQEVARRAVGLARDQTGEGRAGHVGYFLVDRGRKALERQARMRVTPGMRLRQACNRFPLTLYAGSVVGLTVLITVLVCWSGLRRGVPAWGVAVSAALLASGASRLAVELVHWATMVLIRPRLLPRMDFSKGIPFEHRTAVVVPTILTDEREVDDLLDALEVRFLANQEKNLSFALLTDFRDAPAERMPGDEALLRQARARIEALNAKYDGDAENRGPTRDADGPTGDADGPTIAAPPTGAGERARGNFFLFHRARRWNPREGVWMGWERKRGKLEQFNAAVRGEDGGFDCVVGPWERLQGVKYAITLDSDTQLPRDAARVLAATLAHPLNRPHYDDKVGRVTGGYTVLQPRIGVSMPSAARSRFALLFGGDPGIDPYTRAVSDIYQDVFGEGSFIGKAIYDVDAFQRSIGKRFPENRILSHDLLEGALGRAGLVSDVLLFEDYPSSYPADLSRRVRWIRGDWQIAAWLMRRVPGAGGTRVPNSISALSRWKILDNLRRSLVPPALLALLFVGWLLPGGAVVFPLAVVSIVLLPAVLAATAELTRRPGDLPAQQHGRLVARSFTRQVVRELFAIACLPYEAVVNVDAIGRALARVLVTGRRLLEWRTARDAHRTAHADLGGFYRSMWVLPAAAAATALTLVQFRAGSLTTAAPFIGLWFVAPAIAWWLSKPTESKRPRLSPEDLVFLGTAARRIWRFFETFVSSDDNHLPPDNFQEDPPRGAAHRTSPTNIGLSLLANLAAYDFGYLTVGGLIERVELSLRSVEKLPRYRGHLYNWYDTRTLEPLRPRYVSTVDSGNLAGHLLTLAAGLEHLSGHKIFPTSIFSGLDQTLSVILGAAGPEATSALTPPALGTMRELLRQRPTTLSASHRLLRQLGAEAAELTRAVESSPDAELKEWAAVFERQCRQAIRELIDLSPWVELPNSAVPHEWLRGHEEPPTYAEAARLGISAAAGTEDAAQAQEDRELDGRFRAALALGSERAALRLSDLRQLAGRCRELADVDYSFLYDKDRRLLSIGYNADEHRRDAGFYDLLASEARLASFVAIAQGKLPQEHWFSLGRLLTTSAGRPALLSWSGSMFEYLMPLLVMPTYAGTLLDETLRAVVERQIEYGRERGVPWGISESGYAKTDVQLNYQYRAFGVPGLGFKRGLADDLVVTPYASAMALMVDPEAACLNLRRLAREGRLGAYGFYEAVDYTPSRLPPNQGSVVVRSFMAHHQGMTLLSLAYLLLDRPMQRRFESDATFRATDLLLQERVPKTSCVFPHPAEVSEGRGTPTEAGANYRVFTTPQTASPEAHLLSNGRYHVAVTAAGGGYSRWRDLALTRWHADPTRDCWGTFCYLRDVETGEFWSAAHHPTLKRAKSYQAIYSEGRAEFRRTDGDIDTHVEISISPEDDIELRRVSVTNRGRTRRTIELTSFAEVVLAPPAADAAHPAFSNLFVQTQLVRPRQAILCTRRPRSAAERPPWMIHLMTVHGTAVGAASYETARADFIGRGRSVVDPAAMHRPTLSDSEGSVIDPVVAVRNTVVIDPDETVRVHLVTGVSETREGALGLIEKYHDRHSADRVFELAWTQNQVVLRQLDATESEAQLYGRLAGNVLYDNPMLRAAPSVVGRNRRGQSSLWGYGISGDLPIVLLRVGDQSQLDLVRQMLRAHAYWRVKGLATDLVVWNEDQSGYRQVLQEQITGMIASGPGASLVDKPGGIFVRRIEQMSEEDKVLMQTAARVILSDSGGTLAEQMDRRRREEVAVPRLVAARAGRAETRVPAEAPREDLVAFNGIGGFTRDGREYVITTTAESPTPAPWVNVLANPWFGAVVSESGAAYTWCENAHSFRLTPWYNDPVGDTSGESVYLRDEESGRFWSPSPLPARGPMPYTTRHGFGYSTFEYAEGGISSEVWTYVASDAPVKFIVLKLRNSSGRPRRISVTASFELVLGDSRSANLPYVVTEVDPKTGALLARNSYNSEFAERVVFVDSSESRRTVSGDRGEFLGRNGTPADPAAMTRTRLSGRVGAALDPCASMQVGVDLAEGQDREVVFTLGCGRDLADARQLVSRFRGTGPARAALERVWDYWNRTLGAVNVQTPDASLNFLANGWLLYQVLASRLWARSGFYQSGGAFGFRDQLQDVMSLVHAEPGILREHLLHSAAHQFREGDVQHWWHPPLGRGVRTRISDDYLWLPYAACRYIQSLGDTGVLDEKVPFIEGRPVQSNEDSYYDMPARSEESATLYEHCVRSIKNGLRFGEHGLPLMGCGDWNDGMNLVGEHGKGESVWLAFFLYDVMVRFAEVARRRQDDSFAQVCMAQALKLRENIERHGWDGLWYRRAYFDSGQPLGSSSNPECQIDSLPQSWSVLSGAADRDRSRQSLESLYTRLVKREAGLIQLFDPPFDASDLDPGYVKGYVPGVRENGGQYTHAAVWSVMAFAAAGDAARAWELFHLINPVNHGLSEAAIGTYKVEPYVIAADVYMNPRHAGRGGWTWYTGSAGWMYRLITESLLGLRLEVDRLRVEPLMPPDWPSFDIHYRYRQTVHHIHVRNARGGATAVNRVTYDGVEQPDKTIPLFDDRREHHAEVEMGPPVTNTPVVQQTQSG
jgi:cyclic beta-1,2-glucan synthetase